MGIPLAQIEGVAWMTNRQSHCRLTLLGRAGTAIPDRRYDGKVGFFDGKAPKDHRVPRPIQALNRQSLPDTNAPALRFRP